MSRKEKETRNFVGWTKWRKKISHLLQSTTLRRPLALEANSKLKNLFVRNHFLSAIVWCARDGSEKEANRFVHIYTHTQRVSARSRVYSLARVYNAYTSYGTLIYVSRCCMKIQKIEFKATWVLASSKAYIHTVCPAHTEPKKKSIIAATSERVRKKKNEAKDKPHIERNHRRHVY